MIRPALALQAEYDCIYFIADMHALTTVRDPKDLRSQTYDLVATWIALGLDTKKHILFRQSDIPMVAEFTWYLSCVTGMGLLEKAHAYTDAVAKGKEASLGLFYYPALMASDIVMYDVDVVPVGKDQKQHVEMARDMAGSFNAAFGEGTLKLPTAVIDETVMVIPGLDGQKMSKSYRNVIPLFCDEKTMRKLVLSLKTDSTPLEDPKSMANSTLGELYALFGTPDQYRDLEQRLGRGGLGWGHAKDELFQVINHQLAPAREKYLALRNDETLLARELKEGAQRALQIASKVMARIRGAVGVEIEPFGGR